MPMVPEIAAYARQHPDKDFGPSSLSHSEWVSIVGGPVAARAQVPGLVDPDGYLVARRA